MPWRTTDTVPRAGRNSPGGQARACRSLPDSAAAHIPHPNVVWRWPTVGVNVALARGTLKLSVATSARGVSVADRCVAERRGRAGDPCGRKGRGGSGQVAVT